MHVNASLKREPDKLIYPQISLIINWCQIIMTLDSLKGVAVQEIEPLMLLSTNSRLTVPCSD